jgi:hypothetical protein
MLSSLLYDMTLFHSTLLLLHCLMLVPLLLLLLLLLLLSTLTYSGIYSAFTLCIRHLLILLNTTHTVSGHHVHACPHNWRDCASYSADHHWAAPRNEPFPDTLHRYARAITSDCTHLFQLFVCNLLVARRLQQRDSDNVIVHLHPWLLSTLAAVAASVDAAAAVNALQLLFLLLTF